MLNIVVLPAPLGPIIAVMPPLSMVSDTCETAIRPPNRIVIRSATSAASAAVIRPGSAAASPRA